LRCKEIMVMSTRQTNDKTDNWYDFCRPHLENLNPKTDLDAADYAKKLADRAVAINSNVVVYIVDEGGYPVYPSKITPMTDHLKGVDLLAMIKQETKKRGLKFGVSFLGVHANSYVRDNHPEWLQRDKNGNPWPFLVSHLVCPNSPYKHYYPELIREVLTGYPVDYLYVEGLYFRNGTCYCHNCRAEFEALYGRELREDEDSGDFYEFRQESISRFMGNCRKVVDELSPETVVVGTEYAFPAQGFDSTNVRSFSEHVDVVARESQWGHGYKGTLEEKGLQLLLTRAEAKKHVLGTWWAGKDVDKDYAARSVPHAKLTFMGILAYGATVQPHLQTVFDVDQTLVPVLADLFKCVEKVRPYLLEARFLPYAAVLNWAGTRDVKNYLGEAIRGYHASLVEQHIPFDIVTCEDVEAQRLGDYQVVVLPDANRLSGTVIEALCDYVRNGGGLVLTYRSGFFDEAGNKRKRNMLLELAGAQCVGVGGPIKWPGTTSEVAPQGAHLHSVFPVYYRIQGEDPIWRGLNGRLLSYYGQYAEVRSGNDTEVVAHVEDLDYSRMHNEHLIQDAYPGTKINPMILTREVGKGRVVYLAGDLAATFSRVGYSELNKILGGAVIWAAGAEPPVRTNLPPSVEIVVHQSPDKLAVFLVNRSTNQVGRNAVIRHVVPVKEVELQVKIPAPVKKLVTTSGREANYESDGEWLRIRLAEVDEYEVLLIDLAGRSA